MPLTFKVLPKQDIPRAHDFFNKLNSYTVPVNSKPFTRTR